MVATDHVLASMAGATLLVEGGNAVDAAVAAALAAGVVQPSGSGLGGGGFAMVLTAEGVPIAIDFREVAPKLAARDMFVTADTDDSSRLGGLAVAVPGEAAGLATLSEKWGSRTMVRAAQPAIQLARDGFEVGSHLDSELKDQGPTALRLSRALFELDHIPGLGEIVRRVKLANTLERLISDNLVAFQAGPTSRDIATSVAHAGGVMILEDLENYEVRIRDPLIGSYRGWTVYTMPPPSSGGIALLQVLSVLEGTQIATTGGVEWLHRFIEALKHAFADRARYMGDPDRVEIPIDTLLSADRVGEIRSQFNPMITQEPGFYGTPVDPGRDGGTQHISVIDRDGMAVALTTTINTAFGSQVVGAESGVLLNNEMDDFVARPGVPNAYGLVGSEANAVSPGARPLSSMTPTILVSPDGKRRISIGASGGPYIISSTLQVIVNIIDFGMDPVTAVTRPRIHHQWAPNTLFVDTGFESTQLDELASLGHNTQTFPFYSSVQVVVWDGGQFSGASDPRKAGGPAAPR